MYLAIDIGGTKTLLALFSEDGEIVTRDKFPTDQTFEVFASELLQHTRALIENQVVTSCAIALPGVIDRVNGIVESFGNLDWTDIPIKSILEPILNCPMYIENDAKLAALAEAASLRDMYHRVLYVTVSTGIGLGLVVDGQIDYSVHDAGGKAIMMEHQGKLMAWEEFASGKAIVRQTGKMASEITDAKDWYLVSRNLAIGLIDLIVTLSPDCIVIGGGVGAHLQKFHEQLHDELELYRSTMLTSMPQIVQAKHPEEAVVYGGFLLCVQNS